jgi:hypothetical protein
MLRRLLAGSSLMSGLVWLFILFFGFGGAICLGWGVQILERGGVWFNRGVTLSLCGALAVVAVSQLFHDSLSIKRMNRVPLLLVLLAAGMEWWLIAAIRGARINPYPMWALLLIWTGVVFSVFVAAFIYDRAQVRAQEFVQNGVDGASKVVSWARVDSVLVVALLGLAFFLRASGPTTGVVDEIWVLGEFGGLLNNPQDRFWGVSGMSFPYLIHWMNWGIYKLVQGFLGKFDYLKLSVAFAASLAVPAVFCVVRFFAPRTVAFMAGLTLAFMGWHWVNSRFMYVYPYDLGVIGLAVLCAIIAFERRSFSAAVLLGLFWTYSLFATKISVVMIPFTLVVAADYFIRRGQASRRDVLKLVLVIVGVAVLTYAPVLIDNTRGIYSSSSMSQGAFWRYQQAADAKGTQLARYGLTPVSAFFFVYFDAFRQFIFLAKDFFRHYFRPLQPLLDPFTSGLFIVGLVFALVNAWRRRECRIAIYGLLIFILPAAMAFPLDSGEKHAVARRLVGATFFLAWIASMGAHSVMRLLFHGTTRKVAEVASGVAIAITNLYLYQTVYLKQTPDVWLGHQSIDIAAMMRGIEEGQRMGAKVVLLDGPWRPDHALLRGFKPLDVVGSAAEVRTLIEATPKGLVYVIIPAGTPGRNFSSRAVIDELAPVVAPYSWQPGYKSHAGYPLTYYAIVERVG